MRRRRGCPQQLQRRVRTGRWRGVGDAVRHRGHIVRGIHPSCLPSSSNLMLALLAACGSGLYVLLVHSSCAPRDFLRSILH